MTTVENITLDYKPKQYLPDLVILMDPTVEEVNELAKLRPRTFIFPLILNFEPGTTSMLGLTESSRILEPLYIGNLPQEGQKQVIQNLVGQLYEPVDAWWLEKPAA